MMRRWTDQTDAGSRMARRGDDLVDLMSGKFSPFARLRPLRNLDLQFIGIREVPTGHTESARGDLLDGRSLRVPVGLRLKAFVVFPPFTRVTLSTNPVHRDRQCFMSLRGNRTVTHRPGAEATDDRFDRIDFIQRHGRSAGLELQHPSQMTFACRLLVDHFRKLFVCGLVPLTCRLLDVRDVVRIPSMLFARGSPRKQPKIGEHRKVVLVARRVPDFVPPPGFFAQDFKADTTDAAGGASKALLHHVFADPNGLEDLSPLVAGEG